MLGPGWIFKRESSARGSLCFESPIHSTGLLVSAVSGRFLKLNELEMPPAAVVSLIQMVSERC
jgi:hypothetical protein